MATLTAHLASTINTFIDYAGVPAAPVTLDQLKRVLTNTGSGYPVDSKNGQFLVVRTKVWEQSADAYIHGLRIVPTEDNPALLSAVVKTNHHLEAFDTQQPEELWAEQPFWAD